MIFECIVILGILLSLEVIFLRTKRQYAISASPLLIPPTMNIFAHYFADLFSVDEFTSYIIIISVAVIISSVLVGIFSVKFKNKSSKIAYVSMCIIFNIVLASILITDVHHKMF